jgi:hypothetical protein
MRRSAVVAGVALAAAVALSVARLLDPVHAFLVAAVGAVVVLVWRRLDDGSEEQWPDPPEEARAGARHDVSELGWATFTRSGEVSERVLRRVQALAAARLARHGVDLADPARRADVERLLGADVAAGLASRRGPTARTLEHWLDAIERLGPPEPHRGHGRAPEPGPAPPQPTGRPPR